jgi:hypothetical protein
MRQLCESIRAREARIVSRNVDWEILRLNSERARPTHKKNWHDEEEVNGGAGVRPKTAAIKRGAPQGEFAKFAIVPSQNGQSNRNVS